MMPHNYDLEDIRNNPLDTGRRLNVQKTYRRRPVQP